MRTLKDRIERMRCVIKVNEVGPEFMQAAYRDGFFDAKSKAAMIASEAEVPPWVSVEDRLPENDGDYLATDGKNVDLCSYYNRHKLFCPQTHDPEYFKKATHWMELPEPPK